MIISSLPNKPVQKFYNCSFVKRQTGNWIFVPFDSNNTQKVVDTMVRLQCENN
jgi:hypothetical protein